MIINNPQLQNLEKGFLDIDVPPTLDLFEAINGLKKQKKIRKRARQIERTNKNTMICAEPSESEKAESEVIIVKIADGLCEAARIREIRKVEQSLKAAQAAEAEAKRIADAEEIRAWREYVSWGRSIEGRMVREQNWANSY